MVAVGLVAEFVRLGKRQDAGGHFAAGDVLRLQRLNERDEHVGALELRENVILLILLVVLLDEGTDQLGSVKEDLRADVIAAADALHAFFVDQQAAIEHAMLLHQVLGRRYSFVRIELPSCLAQREHRSCCGEGSG